MRPACRPGNGRRAGSWLATLALALGGLAGGAAAGTAFSTVLAGPAGAVPVGSCSTASGVIVVVDFSHWGGNVERGCAATPTTGYAALHAAGFTTAGDDHDGPAYICRIDTDPTPTQTSCVNTPPVSAYWFSWHADAGQTTWSYAEQGAMTYKPPPGSVTAWVFAGSGVPGTSSTGRPPFTPTAVRATNPPPGGSAPTTTAPAKASSPTTTLARGGGPAASKPGNGSPDGGTAPGGFAGAGSSTAHDATASGSSATPAGDGGATSGVRQTNDPPGQASPKIVNVDPASAGRRSSSGSPLPLVVGVVVVVVLGGAAALVAWRRRRASD